MALADTPEMVNKRRQERLDVQAREREEAQQPPSDEPVDPFDPSELSEGLRQGISRHGEAKETSHPAVRQLRLTLRGWHWVGYNQVLRMLEVLCPTDRSFERARKQVLDIANTQERTMAEIVNRLAGPPAVKE